MEAVSSGGSGGGSGRGGGGGDHEEAAFLGDDWNVRVGGWCMQGDSYVLRMNCGD